MFFRKKTQKENIELPEESKEKTKKGLFSLIKENVFLFIRFLKFFVLGLIVLIIFAFYLIISGRPFDLGVKSSEKDALLFEEKIQRFLSVGEKELIFSEKEFSAFLNKSLQEKNNIPLSNIQVNFKRNKIEMVGIFKKALLNHDIPFKVIFQPTLKDQKIVLNPRYLKLGRLPVSPQILSPFLEKIESQINSFLPPKVLKNLKELKIEENKMIFILK